MRSEKAIFDDLKALCSSKGFIHAIAAICFRDQFVRYVHALRPEDMAHLFSKSRLIRTEVTTLIGLMMREPIDFALPPPKVVLDYIKQSEALLDDLHRAMMSPDAGNIVPENAPGPKANVYMYGHFLREPIFYGGESAYSFQFRDLAPRKYRADAAWLLQNKGIDIDISRKVCRSVCDISNERVIETSHCLRDKPVAERMMLPGFAFSCSELAVRTKQPTEYVRAVIEAFTLPEDERNSGFTSLHAFNSAYAYPLIRGGTDEFFMLQHYGMAEALYDSPFYWMMRDKTYAATAARHRGEFTEEFAAERIDASFRS